MGESGLRCAAAAVATALAAFALGAHAGVVDSDDDGLPDELEISLGTDPNDPDSDDDGAVDGDEFSAGNRPPRPH